MTKVEETTKALSNMALYDPLTGLGNRRFLINHLTELKDQTDNNEKDFTVFYFDLDNFKKVNDTLGHKIGDELLIKIAKNLQFIIKKMIF